MLCALLPIKDFGQAKSRLAGVLRPGERRALAQAMARDVLAVLANHAGVARVIVVTDDPGAARLARAHGAACWYETALGAGGLNAVLQAAVARLHREAVGHCLIVHADLPLLGAGDISAALEMLGSAEVIGPDRSGRGTNLLAFATAHAPHLQFGPGSCARHRRDACTRGVAVQCLVRPGIALDIDEPGDLRDLLCAEAFVPRGHTARLLHTAGLGERLAPAAPGSEEQATAPHAGQYGESVT